MYRRNKGESWKTRAQATNGGHSSARRPLPLGSASVLSAARSPSSSPIPEPLRLDRARPNYFLVLSNSCSTCQTIGSGLAAPASRWESAITVLVASDSERHGQEWAASVGLDSPWVFVDDQGKYAKQLGVSSSPTVVRVERDQLTG